MSASGLGGVVRTQPRQQQAPARQDYSQYQSTSRPAPAKKSGGGIFDRLTDTSLYTGAHKARFDQHGQGKGLAGRDRVTKGGGTHGASRNAKDGAYYRGSTNTGTNQTFHDSSEFLTRR
jgi:hypothetical protein